MTRDSKGQFQHGTTRMASIDVFGYENYTEHHPAAYNPNMRGYPSSSLFQL